MKLGIVGSRAFMDYQIFKKVLIENIDIPKVKLIISGGAKGTDTLAKQFAEENEIELKEYIPDWDNLTAPGAVIKLNKYQNKYNAVAGFDRNKLIVENSDIIIAFWNYNSKGTKHSITIAKSLNKKLLIVNIDDLSDNYMNIEKFNI